MTQNIFLNGLDIYNLIQDNFEVIDTLFEAIMISFMKKISALIIVLSTAISCQNLKTLNQRLYNSVPTEFDTVKMKVEGMSGWLPGRNISYGDYSALKIKRRGAKGSSALFFPTIHRHTNLHKKTSFTQMISNGKQAEVYLLEEYSSQGLNVQINESVELEQVVSHHIFSGKIVIVSLNIWSFMIDLDKHSFSKANDLKGEEIAIEFTNYGCDFKIEGERIAGYAVNVFVKNWVSLAEYTWIKPNVAEDKKVILASLITAIMSREGIDLSEEN